MADFRPEKINSPTELNNGKGQYISGVDIPNPDDWNKVINSQLYVQGLAVNPIDNSEANQEGTASASVVTASDGSARLKLSNLKGGKGDTGVGIASITNLYATSSSSSSPPTNWYINATLPDEYLKYAWIKQTINYTDGTTTEIKPYVYCARGAKGDKGVPGETGLRFVSLNVSDSPYTIYESFTRYDSDNLNIEIPFALWLYGVPELSEYAENSAIFLMHKTSLQDANDADIMYYTFCSDYATTDFAPHRIVVVVTINHNTTEGSIETVITDL